MNIGEIYCSITMIKFIYYKFIIYICDDLFRIIISIIYLIDLVYVPE